MSFREVFRFEIGYQLRRPATWLYFVVLLALALFLTAELSRDYARADTSFANGPFIVGFLALLVSMPGLLAVSALASDAAARDTSTRMAPLLYTTPISVYAYLGGRFLAAFVLSTIILGAVPLGSLLAALAPSADPELMGPVRPAAHLASYLVLLLPNAFVAAALMFSLAALSRRVVVGYLGGVFLVGASAFNWTVVAAIWNRWSLAKLLDPLGAVALGELALVWTPAERSTTLIGLQSSLVANRVLWIGAAIAVLVFTVSRVRLAHHSTGGPWKRDALRNQDAWPVPVAVTVPPPGQRTFRFATYARQTAAVGDEAFRAIVMGWGGLVLLAAAAFLVFSVMPIAHMGVPLLATTARMTAALASPLMNPQEINWLIVPLLIVFYAGELVWRERDARINEIMDAAPVPDWVGFLGRFLALGLVFVVLQVLVVASAVFTQKLLGDTELQLGLYAKSLLGFQLADGLLFSLLALVVHSLVNHKQIGHLAAVILYAFVAFGPALGIEHNLLLYGSDPGWTYSDMRGFEPFVGPWLWFKLYWAAWALLLAVVVTMLGVRGREDSLRSRIQAARRRLTPRSVAVAAAAALAIIALGGFIFYNTNMLNAYTSTADGAAGRAEYERRYAQYARVPQPQLSATNLSIEIHPERREVEIAGTFHLVNTGVDAIRELHLATSSTVETTDIRFDRSAKDALIDDELGHRIYALDTPLPSGASLRLEFLVRAARRGFPNRGVNAAVVTNGTYFTNSWLPAIGYQVERELRNAADRRAHGLVPRPAMIATDDAGSQRESEGVLPTAFEATVGTVQGQVAIAPGRLRRTWAQDGRQYFHYATDAPIRNDYAIYSAAYAVHEGRWNRTGQDVAIQVFHHPNHASNVERIVRGTQAALEYYTQTFGPYPHGQVRFIEHPGDGVVLHAAPVNVAYDEGFALLQPERDPRNIDLPFAVVAHEVAHQWWGNTLVPAPVEGAALLTETLAWYSALGVVEQTYGREYLVRLLRMMREVYAMPRASADVPLLRADDFFLAYRKGPLAMYALREYVGADRVNAALRSLLEQHGPGKPLPTSLDLYRQLQAVTPDSLQYLLVDLFETNTLWDLSTTGVTAAQSASGDWRVTLNLRARKFVVDTAGVETDVPMDDWVEVGVFAGDGTNSSGDALHLQMHRVRSGSQRITVTVPRKPARAGIDPRNLLIDRRPDDQLAPIAAGEAKSSRGR